MPEPRALLAQMCLSGIQGFTQLIFSWFPSRAAEILSDLLLLRMTALYCRIVLFVLCGFTLVLLKTQRCCLRWPFLITIFIWHSFLILLSVTYKLGGLWFYVFFQMNELSALWVFPCSGCVCTHLSSVNIVSGGGGLIPHHPLPHPGCMGRKPSLGAGREPGAHCNTCLPWLYYVAIK